jgi:hypothetical protein
MYDVVILSLADGGGWAGGGWAGGGWAGCGDWGWS